MSDTSYWSTIEAYWKAEAKRVKADQNARQAWRQLLDALNHQSSASKEAMEALNRVRALAAELGLPDDLPEVCA